MRRLTPEQRDLCPATWAWLAFTAYTAAQDSVQAMVTARILLSTAIRLAGPHCPPEWLLAAQQTSPLEFRFLIHEGIERLASECVRVPYTSPIHPELN